MSAALTSISYPTAYSGDINGFNISLTTTLMYYHAFGYFTLSTRLYGKAPTVTIYIYYV